MGNLVVALVLAGLIVTGRVAAEWKVDSWGSLIYEGQILGDDSSDDRGSSSGSSGSGSSGSETEVRFSEDERIKTRVREGETRTEVRSGGVKTRIEQKDGRLVIKSETEDGEETELGEQEQFKIEERLDKQQIKVATGSGQSLVFARGTIGARTNFPLSVDQATNTLTVTTPAGTKTVTVLPDAAVANMLAANVIDRLGGAAIAEAARTGQLMGVAGIVELGERAGIPVYEIAGLSEQKLLGFIPVFIKKTVAVSVETGEIVGTNVSLGEQILDFLSL